MATALIVAAGRGERLGSNGPKAFVQLAGRPMIAWSIDAFRQVPAIEQVVVAVPPGWAPQNELEAEAVAGVVVCEGGAERSMSVLNALVASGSGAEDQPILVHDAARPLLTPDLIGRMIAAITGENGSEAAVAASLVADTIRVADAGGTAIATPDRSTLRAVQTPQAFRRRTLERALAQGDAKLAAATDDASLVEMLGLPVRLVDAPSENFKVTNPTDLKLAELVLAERSEA